MPGGPLAPYARSVPYFAYRARRLIGKHRCRCTAGCQTWAHCLGHTLSVPGGSSRARRQIAAPKRLE
eukprot:3233729-Rhodomonas_salina.1